MKKIIFLALGLITFFANAQENYNYTAQSENQPIPDQGNGYYKNPVFPGDYGDPTLVRVGSDYYVAFSKGSAIMIWHSRDLINWEPVMRYNLPDGYGGMWAIDLQYFNGKFHIYMPLGKALNKVKYFKDNYVISSEKITGPWSDPISLDIEATESESALEFPDPDDYYNGIDPGFVQTPKGEKFLYLGHGFAVKLNDDGTKAVSKAKQYYTGWDYPDSWTVECKCLESPKLFYKNGYYYLISAQGGTGGPATAHMSIVARSKNPLGPWENSPYNPLEHTYSYDEPFWHQGHGTVFEAVDGSWYSIFHGRVNGYGEMGRPCLIMPVEWTSDGWPVIKDKMPTQALIPMPKGEKVNHGMPLSDNFNSKIPGMQWSFNSSDKSLFDFGDGRLQITGSGTEYNEATKISQRAVNQSFEASVEVNMKPGAGVAGISLGKWGISTDGKTVFWAVANTRGQRFQRKTLVEPGKVWLKMVNYRKDITLMFSEDGLNWEKFKDSNRDENSYNISLFKYGEGKADFRQYRYMGLETGF